MKKPLRQDLRKWIARAGSSKGEALQALALILWCHPVCAAAAQAEPEADQPWGARIILVLALLVLLVLGLRAVRAKLALVRAEAQADKASLKASLDAQQAMLQRVTSLQSEWARTLEGEMLSAATVIAEASRLLRQGELTPHLREQVRSIDAADHRLRNALSGLVDSAQIEADRLSLTPAPFDLDALLQDFGEATALRIAGQGRELVIEVEPDVPGTLVADAQRLGQLLDAQLELALAQGEPDCDLMLHVGLDQPRVGRARPTLGESLLLRVELSCRRSQGAGPVESAVAADAALSSAVRARVIELMGGSSGLRAGPGDSQVGWFTARMEVGTGDEVAEAVPHWVGRRVLVVDDKENARMMLAKLLSHWGLAVSTAGTGFAAIEAAVSAEAADRRFELMLLDEAMPELGGLETVRLLNARGLHELPALVLMSGEPAGALLRQAQELGVAEVLSKPLGRLPVRQMLQHLLGKAQDPTRPAAAAVQRDAGLPLALQALGGARVLLVEDNEINQQIALELLQASGMEVQVAPHGQAALELLNWQYFDLVLMDLHMPVLDGLSATQQIRADQRHARLPIVAMTASGSQLERRRCLEAGMDAHLLKPFDLDNLWGVLQRWIAPRPGLGQEDPLPLAPVGRPALPHMPRLPQSTPGLDVQRALGRMGQRIDLYLRTAQMFIDTQSDAVEQVREALALGDRPAAIRIATTLKNLAGNLGAEGLQTETLALEACLREASDALINVRAGSVEESLTVVCFALKTMLSAQAPVPADALIASDGEASSRT